MSQGERASSRPAVLAAALLLAPQMAARATRDALFLSTFPVALLPRMTAAAAVASLLATFAFSRVMGRRSPGRVLPVALGLSAVLFLAEWPLALAAPRLAAVVVYLHHAVLGAILVSGFWSLVSERFDPHTARHSMGAIGAGAALGGVVGSLLTWQAARLVSVPTMLPALAIVSVLGLVSVVRIGAAVGTAVGTRADEPQPGSALPLIRDLPYLRRLALLVTVTAALEAPLDYLLSAAAVERFGGGASLMSFFALFHGGSGLLALAVQVALVPLFLRRLGVAGTLAVQPAFAAAAAAVALAAPRLATILLLRAGQAVLRISAFRSSYELLYTPLPNEQKRPAKVVIDVGCDRVGTVLGSAAVIVVLLLAPRSSTRILLVLAGAAAALALALVPRFRGGYVDALARSLRAGTGAIDPASVVDPTTLLTLASVQLVRERRTAASPPSEAAERPRDTLLAAAGDLRSGDAERVRAALSASELDPRLVGHVIPLLADDALFAAVVRALRGAATRATGQLVDALLDEGLDPVVRQRLARVLRGVPTQRAADGLLLGLEADRSDVRYRSGQALVRLRARNDRIAVPRGTVLAIVVKEAAIAGSSDRHLNHVFNLLALLLDREPLEAALAAVRAGDPALRGTALEYLDHVLPPEVREKLWPHLVVSGAPAASGRSPEEIRDELLRSSAALAIPRPKRSPDG